MDQQVHSGSEEIHDHQRDDDGAPDRERRRDPAAHRRGRRGRDQERGAATTTLDDIRARTATSKSQIFHYFPGGKDELLLAVAALEAERILEDQQPHLDDLGRLDTWQAWRDWRDAVVRRYERQGVNCPLGVLMTELGRRTPASQRLTGQLLAQWQSALRDGVRCMQRSARMDPALDADRTAAALIAAVQGGVTVLMATGGIAHLEAALDTTLELLGRFDAQ